MKKIAVRNMDSMDDMLGDGMLELRALQDRIDKIESENSKLKEIIIDNDLEEELEGIDCTSIEEQICLNGIKHIAELVKNNSYDDKDIKNFDVLLKALRMIRGQAVPKSKEKKTDIKEALKIVEGI